MIQNENVAPVNPAPATQIGLSNVVLPTLNGKPAHDQTEIRHALLDMNKTIQSVQNNIPVASSGSLLSGTPLQPLTSAISGNFTYSAPSTSGFYSVYVPSAYLVAASGGPYTLTIQSGSTPGSTVKVPISAFGNTIASGNLLFDIYVDSNSNVTAKDFQVSGSNSNGSFVQFADRTMECRVKIDSAGTVTWTFPVPFIDTSYVVVPGTQELGVGNIVASVLENTGTPRTVSAISVFSRYYDGSFHVATINKLFAQGRWM